MWLAKLFSNILLLIDHILVIFTIMIGFVTWPPFSTGIRRCKKMFHIVGAKRILNYTPNQSLMLELKHNQHAKHAKARGSGGMSPCSEIDFGVNL